MKQNKLQKLVRSMTKEQERFQKILGQETGLIEVESHIRAEFDKIEKSFETRDYTNAEQLLLVKANPAYIRFITNPIPEIQMYVMMHSNKNAALILNSDNKTIVDAIEKISWKIIKYISNPTYEMQLAAIKVNQSALLHITNLDERLLPVLEVFAEKKRGKGRSKKRDKKRRDDRRFLFLGVAGENNPAKDTSDDNVLHIRSNEGSDDDHSRRVYVDGNGVIDMEKLKNDARIEAGRIASGQSQKKDDTTDTQVAVEQELDRELARISIGSPMIHRDNIPMNDADAEQVLKRLASGETAEATDELVTQAPETDKDKSSDANKVGSRSSSKN